MSTELIGLENIPNVYIEKIILSNSTEQEIFVNINLELYDKLPSQSPVWSRNEMFTPFLKVCLIQTSDLSLSDQLTQGRTSPVPKKLFASNGFDRAKTHFQTYSIKQFSTSTFEGNTVFKIKTSFRTPEQQNLSVFAFCFLDTDQVSKNLNIDLTNMLDDYYGAVTSEKVFIGGQTPKTSVFYISPDNTIYTGPVHSHQGKYMQGSLHTANPHSSLKTITRQNLKLIDDRDKKYNIRKNYQSYSNALISDSYFSIDQTGALSGLFSFNVKEFALSKTKYGKKLLSLNENLFVKFMNTIRIDSLKINRKQVKLSRGSNKLQTPIIVKNKIGLLSLVVATEESSPGKLRNHRDDDSQIQQVFIDPDRSIRNYLFSDFTKDTNSYGSFQYTVEVSIIDGSQEFFNNLIIDIQRDYSNLKDEMDFLNSRVNYDYSIDKLKDNKTVPQSIELGIKKYYEIFSMINDVTKTQQRELIKDKLFSFSQGNYNANAAERFLSDYRDLISQFIGKFRTTSTQNISFGKVSPKKASIPNLMAIRKEFSEVITFRQYSVSYNYLGLESAGLKVVSTDGYDELANKNIDRYFDGAKSYTQGADSPMDPAIASAITDFSSSKYLYFSPLAFNVNDRQQNVDRLDQIDLLKLSGMFVESIKTLKSIRRPTSSLIPKKTRRGVFRTQHQKPKKEMRVSSRAPTFSFERFKPPTKVEDFENELEYYIDSSEYLGNNSEFPKTPEFLKPTVIEQEDLGIFTSLNIKASENIIRDKKIFDITKKENIINKIITSKTKDSSIFRKAPIPLKALLASRTSAARNNVLESDSDILKDTETRIATEISFFSIQKIEVLTGYGLDLNGVKMLSKPIWKPMTPELLNNDQRKVCRMVYEENEDLQLKPDENFKFPALDRIFILSNEDILTDLPEPQISSDTNFKLQLKNDLSKKAVYSTTNTVIQNRNKMSIFNEMSPQAPTAPPTTQSTVSSTLTRTTTSPMGSGGGGY